MYFFRRTHFVEDYYSIFDACGIPAKMLFVIHNVMLFVRALGPVGRKQPLNLI